MPDGQPEPTHVLPHPDWPHYALYNRVRQALYALPFHFQTETVISGIMATDIFTLNATLGATMEDQVVNTLNAVRHIWDPNEEYGLYGFVRQPQTFPDVLLRRLDLATDREAIIMGIELKGWYLLAKEGEPSFRFQVTPSACSIQDLIAIAPWALSNVISGSPRVFTPFVESARYAAEYRNYHWCFVREASSSADIVSPEGITPYPRKSDSISDKPRSDAGGNFGRFARTGIMDEYLEIARSERLCGIEATHWLSFFRAFHEQTSTELVAKEVAKLRKRLMEAKPADPLALDRVTALLDGIEGLLGHPD